MKTQLRRINSVLVLTALSLFVLAIYSCRQQEQSISEEPEVQVIPLDTALFTDLIQQKINALSGHTPFDVRGAKIYADRSLSRLYHLNNFLPLWSNGEMYKTFIKILEEIHFDGLLSRDYNLNLLKSLYHQIDTAQHLDHDILSDLDLVATNSFLLLTLHLVEGKSEPHLLDPNWNYNFFHIDPHGIDSVYHYLSRKKIEYLVNRIRARNELYADMRKTLIDLYRIKANGGWDSVVYEGKVKIEPGDSAATIPLIRKRLIATDTLLEVAPVQVYQYDSGLVSAVVRFQHQHGLAKDGIIGTGTLDAMNIPVDKKIEKVRVNLERARWLINDLIQKRVIVNIASFNAYLLENDSLLFRSRVMVGKPYTKTPVFESTLSYVEFNPTWTVPPGILKNETLPRMRKDPNYLRDRNMQLLNYQGQEVSLEEVDLNAPGGRFPYMVRQGAGPGNALGKVKFIFPNSFSVYLHDTPSRYLFARSERAFSHGCIRIENPLQWAEQLLNDPQWDLDRINRVVSSGKTQRVFPKEKIRVMILYLTHITVADGTFFYPDVYDRDQEILQVLNNPIDEQVIDYKKQEILKVTARTNE